MQLLVCVPLFKLFSLDLNFHKSVISVTGGGYQAAFSYEFSSSD